MHDLLRYLIDTGIVPPGTTVDQLRALLPAIAEETDAWRALALEPSTWRDDDRSVEGILSTDRPVAMPDWERMEMVDEILLPSGFRSRSGDTLPLLDSHSRYSVRDVLGSIGEHSIRPHAVAGRLSISEAEPAVATKVREGHLRGISVGYRVTKSVIIEPGESKEVAGKTYKAAKTRARRVVTEWEAAEASLTPIQADVGATVRSRRAAPLSIPPVLSTPTPQRTAAAPQKKGATMHPFIRRFLLANPSATADQLDRFRAWLDEQDAPTEDAARAWLADQDLLLDAESPEQARQRTEGQQRQAPSADPAAAAAEQFRAFQAADRARKQAIRSAAAPYIERPGVREMVETALDSETSADQFRASLLEKLPTLEPEIGRPTVTRDAADKRRRAVADALSLRAGGQLVDARGRAIPEAEQRERTTTAGDFRGLTLFELARQSLEVAGVRTTGMERMDLVGRAFSHSTSDFSAILEDTARRALLNAFATAEVTWREFASISSLSDFRAHGRAVMSEAGVLEEVPEGAEIPEHTITDKKETIALKTYGKIFGVTRQAIINDDLSAFKRVPAMHGRAWARTINFWAYDKIMANAALSADNVALYHSASHLNLDTSATAVTTVSTAAAIVRLFAKKLALQKDIDGESLLNLMLRTIVVGPTLAPYYEQALYETGLADNNSAVDIRGKGYRLVKDAEVENTAHAAGSATNATYGFADPTAAPCIEVGFLDGNETPRMERQDGFEVEGVRWKVAGDVAVAAVDYRGTQKHVN